MKKKFQDMTIQDAFMFAAVMADPEKCRKLLTIILNVPILEVTVITEKTMAYHPEFHGVRLDVMAKEQESNRRFNVEMQVKKKDNLPKRSRYYHSQMDMDLLVTGVDYTELPECYVIFICDFDPFDDELYVYSIRNICKENEKEVEDGTQTIWLSTKGKNKEDTPKELVDFLEYVGDASKKGEKKDTYEGFAKELEERIRAIKKNRDWEAKFMLLQEMIKEERQEAFSEGKAEGEKEGKIEGKKEGKMEALIDLLSIFEEKIPADILERLQSEKDTDTLTKWLKAAAKAKNLEEFIQKM